MRFRRGFLWLPCCLEGEWRWLEMAGWVEECQARTAIPVGPDVGYSPGHTYLKWTRTAWLASRKDS